MGSKDDPKLRHYDEQVAKQVALLKQWKLAIRIPRKGTPKFFIPKKYEKFWKRIEE